MITRFRALPAAVQTARAAESRPLRGGDSFIATVVVVLAALASATMLWSRRAYVPIWDGRIYADCVIDASRNLLDVGGFRCAGHISHSYVALLALAQAAAPTSSVAILVMNSLLLVLGIVALFRVLMLVFPSPEHRVGRALVAASFAVHPVVLASVVQPGLDFGMLVFSLCTLAAVLEGRRWAVVLFGILLVFAKEPAVLVYGVLAAIALWRDALRRILPNGAYWIAVSLTALLAVLNVLRFGALSAAVFCVLLYLLAARREPVSGIPLGSLLRATLAEWTLAIPLLLVFGYMGGNALRVASPMAAGTPPLPAPVVWGNAGPGTLVRTLFRSGIIDRSTITVLALMFVVGFLWLPTLLILVDAVIGAVRRRRLLPSRPLEGVNLQALGLVTATLVGEAWLLSRYITFANARYYLPVYPLALIVAYAALVRLAVSRAVRLAAFGSIAVLLGLSAIRTIDPVSRAVWGTFAVGEHPMLVVTSLTGECCGAGRDQLVYNLEFTEFGALTDEALAAIRPNAQSFIVLPILGDWYTVGPLDAATHRRTLSRGRTVTPRTPTAGETYVHAAAVPDAWYLQFPYLDNSESLTLLDKRFEVGSPMPVDHDGYRMDIRRLRLRHSPMMRPASVGPTLGPAVDARP